MRNKPDFAVTAISEKVSFLKFDEQDKPKQKLGTNVMSNAIEEFYGKATATRTDDIADIAEK